jgi:anthranilate phosphoribosyltransferase
MPVEHALVVHGAGIDEIGIHDETVAAEVVGDEVTEFTIAPADLGLDRAPIEAVAGGTPEENAADLRGIVDGSLTGPKRDLVRANAGAAIYVAGEADSLAAGVERAAESIDSGAAAEKFAALCGDGPTGDAEATSSTAAGPEDDD